MTYHQPWALVEGKTEAEILCSTTRISSTSPCSKIWHALYFRWPCNIATRFFCKLTPLVVISVTQLCVLTYALPASPFLSCVPAVGQLLCHSICHQESQDQTQLRLCPYASRSCGRASMVRFKPMTMSSLAPLEMKKGTEPQQRG